MDRRCAGARHLLGAALHGRHLPSPAVHLSRGIWEGAGQRTSRCAGGATVQDGGRGGCAMPSPPGRRKGGARSVPPRGFSYPASSPLPAARPPPTHGTASTRHSRRGCAGDAGGGCDGRGVGWWPPPAPWRVAATAGVGYTGQRRRRPPSTLPTSSPPPPPVVRPPRQREYTTCAQLLSQVGGGHARIPHLCVHMDSDMTRTATPSLPARVAPPRRPARVGPQPT